ncbi:hypothetical protein BGZ96_008371 [Linnemannia gamsii]|uniref:Uncharacterized protein n=1 Tax=Linnemannia gamsii TaxID=64522 RepID=A0ABQ7JYF0_9FUNG|nr:hypothetical protein BGZ96_008371 [Linnemannia gamsii]
MDAKELKQSADNYKKKEKAWYLHQSDLYRDTVWALAVPVLGQLESLTFPILGIWRWTTVVDSLERLETLVFILDETFDRDYINTYFPAESIPVSQQQRKWLMADEEAEAMQAMVFFVNEHTRHFRGRLKSVNAEGRKHASLFEVLGEVSGVEAVAFDAARNGEFPVGCYGEEERA